MAKPVTLQVQTFDSPAAFFSAIFGPPQHNAHVVRRYRYQVLRDAHAHADAGNARCAAFIEEMRAANRRPQ